MLKTGVGARLVTNAANDQVAAHSGPIFSSQPSMDHSRRHFILFALAVAALAVLFAWPRAGGPGPAGGLSGPGGAPLAERAQTRGTGSWDRLAQSEFAVSIRESEFAFPVLESVHLIGAALFFGSILMLDLRLLGMARYLPLAPLGRLFLPLTWVGFATLLASGIPLFVAFADQYSRTISFPLKLALIGLGGINMLAFQRAERRHARAGSSRGAGASVALAASVSIAVWTAVTAAGRWVGYERQPVFATENRPPAGGPPAAMRPAARVLFMREIEANAFAVSVGEGSPPEEFTRLSGEACGEREVCSVDVWEVVGQQATRRFSYSRDRRSGTDRALWDCRRYPAIAAGQCL